MESFKCGFGEIKKKKFALNEEQNFGKKTVE